MVRVASRPRPLLFVNTDIQLHDGNGRLKVTLTFVGHLGHSLT